MHLQLNWPFNDHVKNHNYYLMKISKSVIQAVAAAVIVSSVVSCTSDLVNPEKEKGSKTKNVDPCPACGMG